MKHKALYITLFALIVAALALPAVQQHGKLFKFLPLYGATEVTEKPEFTFKGFMSGAYQAQEDQYLSENIGFREPMIRCYNQLVWSLFHKTQNKTIFINDDNWIFNDYTIKHFYGQSVYDFGESSEAVLQKMQNDAIMVYQLQEVLKEYGIAFFVCLAPGKDLVCAEHVPVVKGFTRPPGIRAIDHYPTMFDSLGINYLDFSKHYMEIKDTVSYPLYLKSSSHWSNQAAVFAADSLFRYMEELSGINMHNLVIGDAYIDKTHFLDSDLEDVMNLLWPIETGENEYNHFSIDHDTTAIKPKLFTVGDSYYKGFIYNLPLDQFFETHHYWYYNKIVHDDPLHTNVDEVDIVRELLSSDMVMLMYTSCNLFDLNRQFLTRALFNLYYEDGVVEAKLEEIKRGIKNTPDWFAGIEQDALKRGEDVEQVLDGNARYLLYGSPGLYFDEFNQVEVPSCRNSRIAKVLPQVKDRKREKYRQQMLMNKEWLASIREKAKASNISVEEAIERDLDWIFSKLDQE